LIIVVAVVVAAVVAVVVTVVLLFGLETAAAGAMAMGAYGSIAADIRDSRSSLRVEYGVSFRLACVAVLSSLLSVITIVATVLMKNCQRQAASQHSVASVSRQTSQDAGESAHLMRHEARPADSV
jgi:hypothetical protein